MNVATVTWKIYRSFGKDFTIWKCYFEEFKNFNVFQLSSGIFRLLENFLNFKKVKKIDENIDERFEDRRTVKYLFDVIIRVN